MKIRWLLITLVFLFSGCINPDNKISNYNQGPGLVADDSNFCDTSQLITLDTGSYLNQDNSKKSLEIKKVVSCGISYNITLQAGSIINHDEIAAIQNGKAVSVKTKICIPTPCAPPPPDDPDYQCPPYCTDLEYSLEIIANDEFYLTSSMHELEGRYLKK